jgi:CRP-like cAMP-binding protein
MTRQSHFVARSDVVARLAGVDLFGRCSKGDLRIVARHAERLSVAAGTEVVRQGDAGDAFFLLLSGKATVARDGVDVAELGAGDFFGELALLDPAPRAATVTVTSPAELAVLGARMFKVLLRELPALSATMLASLARRARDAGAVGHE